MFDIIMHQSIPAAPSPPPPGWPPGISIFFCLGWQIPGGGDSWALKSPGVGTKKEGKWSINADLIILMCAIFRFNERVPFL